VIILEFLSKIPIARLRGIAILVRLYHRVVHLLALRIMTSFRILVEWETLCLVKIVSIRECLHLRILMII
jgi:hypothetical protein